MGYQRATEEQLATVSLDVAGADALGVISDDAREIAVVAADDFDSAALGLQIGKLRLLEAAGDAPCLAMLRALITEAGAAGFEQLVRRMSATRFAEIHALEQAGFVLVDVGLTFTREPPRSATLPEWPDLLVRASTDADMEAIVPVMIQQPWWSRYEADSSYEPVAVRELRARWLWNSHRHRAAVVAIGVVDDKPAGYVTCLLDQSAERGVIELVGTLPAFRGRGVAARTLQWALHWFSGRASLVTVRTQATNVGAARLYERAGFLLHEADVTMRIDLSSGG